MKKDFLHSPDFRHMFRALGSRNYRLFFSGQIISLVGTWMQQIATGWLVYRLTDSPFLLGLTSFAGQIPTCIATPFAGVLADSWNRHRMLIAVQVFAMIQATVLTVMLYTGTLTIPWILVLSVALGVISAFDIPARQALLVDLIEDKKDLSNAIALNSSMFNAARLVGPSLAGIVIAWGGESLCFLLNAISYIPVIIALAAVTLPPQKTRPTKGLIMSELRDGFRYAFGSPSIRSILLLVATTSGVGLPYAALMPIFARDVLGGGADTLGFLNGASGCGALVGALYLASRKTLRGLGKRIVLGTSMFSLAIILFSMSTHMPVSLFVLFFSGLGMMVQMAACNTIIQTIVDDSKRGRVMSIYTMAFMGLMPIGSLIMGSLAHSIGAPLTIMAGGALCLAGAIRFSVSLPVLQSELRPIYIQKGIIVESSNLRESGDEAR